MARHRRHRRRHRRYGGLMKIPGLSGFKDVLKGSVKVTDLGIGILAGFGGVVGVTYLVDKYAQTKGSVSMALYKAIPFLGGLAAGGGLYMLRRKKNKAQANALLAGAVLGGALPVGWDLVKKQFASLSFLNAYVAAPGMSGYVQTPGLSAYGGVIVDNVGPAQLGGYGGVIVDNAGPAQLSAYGDPGSDMGAEDVAEALAP